MADICQDHWEVIRPDEYFPDGNRWGTCGVDGDERFVARVRQDEVDAAIAALQAQAEQAFGPVILHGDV